MKKFATITLTFLVACATLLSAHSFFANYANAGDPNVSPLSSTTSAPTNSATTEEVLPGYKEGLWQEGKAVFSDIELLDIFTPYARGYRPKQPIAFSHNRHVEVNKIECQYCHSGVTKSPYATIPSVEVCMGCHKVIKTESPEIQKLAKHYKDKTPIEWEPVHHLPEHVFFNHSRHVKAGVGCQKCHGQVQKTNVVEKVSSMKMGFCVSCHRDQGASIDCATCHY